MADEVTKKDLQSLQGYCNKQIADLEKRLTAQIDKVEKGIMAHINKTLTLTVMERIRPIEASLEAREDPTKRLNALEKQLATITDMVNQHGKAIGGME